MYSTVCVSRGVPRLNDSSSSMTESCVDRSLSDRSVNFRTQSRDPRIKPKVRLELGRSLSRAWSVLNGVTLSEEILW